MNGRFVLAFGGGSHPNQSNSGCYKLLQVHPGSTMVLPSKYTTLLHGLAVFGRIYLQTPGTCLRHGAQKNRDFLGRSWPGAPTRATRSDARIGSERPGPLPSLVDGRRSRAQAFVRREEKRQAMRAKREAWMYELRGVRVVAEEARCAVNGSVNRPVSWMVWEKIGFICRTSQEIQGGQASDVGLWEGGVDKEPNRLSISILLWDCQW